VDFAVLLKEADNADEQSPVMIKERWYCSDRVHRTDRVARKSIPSSCVGMEKWKI